MFVRPISKPWKREPNTVMESLRETAHKEANGPALQAARAFSSPISAGPGQPSISEWEADLVRLLRDNRELSKGELVTHTGYSRTKVSGCIESLINKRILVMCETTAYSGGRRSKTFKLNEQLALVGGMHIASNDVNLCVADFAGGLIVKRAESACAKDGPIKTLGTACSVLESMLKDTGMGPERVRVVAIGVRGPVDFASGAVISPSPLPRWEMYPLAETVRQWFPAANVVIDSEANMMAMGERSRGIAKGIDNMIFIKIGSGIAAGIICGGAVYRGSTGCAGEIGHICVMKDGPVCHCGNRGCLETVAAGQAIAERALAAARAGKSARLMEIYESSKQMLRAEDVGEAARDGDALAIEVIRDSGQAVGDVLAGLVNFYNPAMIVVGGGVSHLGNLLLSSIRQEVFSKSLPLATRDLQIVFSTMGPDSGIFGAVSVALDHVFDGPRDPRVGARVT
jgi:glucokinase-like ROK family protein